MYHLNVSEIYKYAFRKYSENNLEIFVLPFLKCDKIKQRKESI